MKFTLLPALALLMAAGLATAPAQAAGCLKGAAVGAVAGHVAGHHGLLGAGAVAKPAAINRARAGNNVNFIYCLLCGTHGGAIS